MSIKCLLKTWWTISLLLAPTQNQDPLLSIWILNLTDYWFGIEETNHNYEERQGYYLLLSYYWECCVDDRQFPRYRRKQLLGCVFLLVCVDVWGTCTIVSLFLWYAKNVHRSVLLYLTELWHSVIILLFVICFHIWLFIEWVEHYPLSC